MKPVNYYLGCSGWYYDHWIKRFYPENLKKSEWLSFYAQYFNTVEINSTFYRFPSERMLKSWYEKTPEDFLFTLKVNQSITHRRRFRNTDELLRRFYHLSNFLGDKLGCLLFQLPPNIKKDMELLNTAIEQLDRDKKNVIEFRHPTWFDEEVYEFLRENDVTFCSVSVSNFPEDLITTSSRVYVRFHGTGENERYSHSYSSQELTEWADKIKDAYADEVFCYFNNDFEANAVFNCKQLRELLQE